MTVYCLSTLRLFMQSGIQATRQQLMAQRTPAATQATVPVSTETSVVTRALQWGQVVSTGTLPTSNAGPGTNTTWAGGGGGGTANPYSGCCVSGGPYCPPYC